ncbi:hypothetical protein BDV93DRAFT_606018 [Ceratobasidium sp. AG-I]|nr:hypothetical protein BDV93DRAFT_606018 [Ceratobasidium sp. AG-I]
MQSLEPPFHPLFVSDVLHLICDLLEVPDWMALMLTCKSTFATAASHIWANLDGVQVLTDLLVEATEAEGNDVTPSDTAIDFSRFDIYAPLVRHLCVYGRTSKYLRGEYRRRCAQRSQQNALFPKLESITMRTSDLHHDSDALMWIEVLATPTLAELRVIPIQKHGATAFVSYSATANVSKLLSDLCPRIKKLELFPSNIANNENIDTDLDVLWQSSLRRSFESLVYLREVTTNITLVDHGGLAILGALPCLQKLSIDGSLDQLQDLQLSMPDNSFLALSNLSLVQVKPDSLLALMGVLPLVRRLISVSLIQRFNFSEDYYYDKSSLRKRWLSDNLPLFIRNSPSLQRFSYDAGQSSQYTERSPFEIEGTFLLQAISKSHLEYISLLGLDFNLDFIQGIATACPSLIELQIPEVLVLNQDLHWLARLPKLRRLSVRLSFHDLPLNWHSFNGPLEALENTTSNINEPELVDSEQAAKFLLSSWPNLRLVVWPFRQRLRYGHWRRGGELVIERHRGFIDKLNDAIDDVRLRKAEVE